MNGSNGIVPTVDLATNNGFAPYGYGANGGFFGGSDAIWGIILIALLFNNGFGGFGNNGYNNLATTDYISIATLIISQQGVPRLAENLHKECFIATKDGKQVFIVQLATDDNTPKGIILMWSGDINDIPPGYGVCDGRTINGIQMPNLSGRFIKMIDSNGSVGPVDNQDLESDGKSIKIKENNLPNHRHNIQVTVEQYTGSDSYSYVSNTRGTSVDEGEGNSVTTGDIVSTNSSSINLTHTHNATATNENDNYANDPINIQPNYYALIFIMKL